MYHLPNSGWIQMEQAILLPLYWYGQSALIDNNSAHNNKLMVHMYIVKNTTIFLIVCLLLIRYNYMFRPSMLAIFRLYMKHLTIGYIYMWLGGDLHFVGWGGCEISHSLWQYCRILISANRCMLHAMCHSLSNHWEFNVTKSNSVMESTVIFFV